MPIFPASATVYSAVEYLALWTKRFIIPTIYSWHKCPNAGQLKRSLLIPLSSKYNRSCKNLPLNVSAPVIMEPKVFHCRVLPLIYSSVFCEWTLNIFLTQTSDTRHVALGPLLSDTWSILFLEFLAVECHETNGYIHEPLKRGNTEISSLYSRF